MTGLNRASRALVYGRRVLLVIAAAFLLSGAPGHVLAAGAAAAVNEVKPSLKTVDIPVDGMECVACAANIRKIVKSLEGVSFVEVSLEKRTARVTYAVDKISPDRIVAAVDKLGYKAGIPREVE